MDGRGLIQREFSGGICQRGLGLASDGYLRFGKTRFPEIPPCSYIATATDGILLPDSQIYFQDREVFIPNRLF